MVASRVPQKTGTVSPSAAPAAQPQPEMGHANPKPAWFFRGDGAVKQAIRAKTRGKLHRIAAKHLGRRAKVHSAPYY